MNKIQQRVMARFYREAAGDPARLPWHHETPTPFLKRAIEARADTHGRPLRALDVGCGSGVFAVQMARLGLEVTAIDNQPAAIEMARTLAREHGVEVELAVADAFEWAPEHGYAVVFDSGCLHNFSGTALTAYRAQLLRWLEPGGDFVLAHWGRRHALDWRPIGPRRRTRKELVRLFAPELQCTDGEFADEKVPFPFGPRVRMASYWFRRPPT